MDDRFLSGLVFGFDVGTSSIGFAVRRGGNFLEAGVVICPEDTADLKNRRGLRRQRRTLRSRHYRRKWFRNELAKLGIPPPRNFPDDPVSLRVRALTGEKLTPEDLHAALAHLFKRRGYSEVPWANRENVKDAAAAEEEGIITRQVQELRDKLGGSVLPCQYLASRRNEIGNSPTDKWARRIYWPRELLEKEFRGIIEAQTKHFPNLAEKADWLLYGDAVRVTKNGKTFRVFFDSEGARNPGILGLRWPRFDNRGPALDALQPVDEQGRPRHVVRKNKAAFAQAQWELAVMNLRVVDAATRQKCDPRIHFPVFIQNLRNEWNKKGRVTLPRLAKLAEPFRDRFLLVEGQKPLSPETGQGRAKFSSPTLELIRKEIGNGRQVDPPQPILRREGEKCAEALNRYLAEIKHPLVRHRLILFRGLLAKLVGDHGEPDMIIVEAVRSLALGQKAKNELNKRNEEFRRERETAREDLAAVGRSVSRKALTRYRLWKEAQSTCPFCCEKITQEQLHNGQADIEHLVPRATLDCNQFFNLTVGHIQCNRDVKRDRTPFHAFATDKAKWEQIKSNAEKCFRGRKLEIFLSPVAEELVERTADLQHTAYIARVVRHVSLIQLGWLNQKGKDPTPEKQNAALRFQVTNGQLTSRLRKSWGLNQILHPLPAGKRWEDLTGQEKELFGEKNRGDLRHHALDAMVISCTLPWLAHRTHGAVDEFGRHGWWTQDEKERSKAANPIFPIQGQMHQVVKEQIDKVVVRHHVSRSNHQKAYATTLYARKEKDTYVARKEFSSLTPKKLSSIWPREFAAYCEAAWKQYSVEVLALEEELKRSKGSVPQAFCKKLCFSHFQRWRADAGPAFKWPERVKIPIRSVRLISVKDDRAVVPFSKGTRAYVKRTGFKEVRIHVTKNGKAFVPVFVPYDKNDTPLTEKGFLAEGVPIAVIRRGMVVETNRPFSTGQPAGKYRVIATSQKQLTLLPHFVANEEDAIRAFGLGKKGLQPYWPDFIRALGYELPHSASAQS